MQHTSLEYVGSNPTQLANFFLISYCSSVGQSTRLITDRSQVQILPVGPNFSNVREATVGCVAADCNPAHQKHRWFDSNRVHQFQKALLVVMDIHARLRLL
jgi:hypothetical protein